jgi:hypothetical protein
MRGAVVPVRQARANSGSAAWGRHLPRMRSSQSTRFSAIIDDRQPGRNGRRFPLWNHERMGADLAGGPPSKPATNLWVPHPFAHLAKGWETTNLDIPSPMLGAPSFRALGERVGDHEPRRSVSHAGCPILSRSWRKGGRPRTSPFRLPCSPAQEFRQAGRWRILSSSDC